MSKHAKSIVNNKQFRTISQWLHRIDDETMVCLHGDGVVFSFPPEFTSEIIKTEHYSCF